MYIEEKERRIKIMNGVTLERNQWHREKATLINVNSKLAKMIEQVNNKISHVRKSNC